MAFSNRPAPPPRKPGLAKAGALIGTAGKSVASLKNPAKPGFTPYKPPASRPGNAAPGAAPAKPGARPAAPVVGAPAQPDSQYQHAVAAADRNQQQGLNALQGQESQVKFNFGIDDPTNPFSRAESLKKAYLAKLSGTSAALASQGQLYSGTHERAMARVREQNDQARAELRQAYDSALGNIAGQKQSLQNMTEDQKNAAFDAWLQRAPGADVPVPDAADNAPDASGPSQLQPAGTPLAPPPNPSDRSLLPVYAATAGPGYGSKPQPRHRGGAKKVAPAKPQSVHRIIPPPTAPRRRGR